MYANQRTVTHAKEFHEFVAFQVACLGVSICCPDFLEGTHLFARDFFGPSRHLEDIEETFDHNTCHLPSAKKMTIVLMVDGHTSKQIREYIL